MPVLLRYETDDFFNGHGYTGPIEESATRRPAMPRRLSRCGSSRSGPARWAGPGCDASATSPDAVLVGLVDLDPSHRGAAAADDRPRRRRRGRLAGEAARHGGRRRGASTSRSRPPTGASAPSRCVRGLPVLCEKPLAETVSGAPVHGRRGRARRPAADGLPVAPLLPPPADVPRRRSPSSARSGRSTCSFCKAPHFGGFRERDGLPAAGRHGHPPVRPVPAADRRRPGGGLLRVVQPELELVRR